jgi:hypothetical protein
MKIAVCLSGHPRSFETTAPTLKKLFGDADFYFSTWQGSNDQRVLDICASNDIQLRAYEFVAEPKQLENERTILTDFQDSYPDFFILNQWFGVKRCIRLMQDFSTAQSEKYDLVVRCRFDLLVDFSIQQMLDRYVPNAINIVKASAGSDQFSFGSPDVMENFLNFEKWLLQYATSFGTNFGFYASPLMRAFFLDLGIPVNIINLPLLVFRTDDSNPKTAREARTKAYILQHFPELSGVAWRGKRKIDHMKKPGPWDAAYYPNRPFFFRNGKSMTD